MTKNKLKALIKEEIQGIMDEGKRSPSSEEDWSLVHDAARVHLHEMLSAIGRMVADKADSFEDTLSHHYGLEFNDGKEFLMRELATLLRHKKV